MQVEDQELKSWVVRSDVGVKPAWLKQDHIVGAKSILDVTEVEAEAHHFADFDHAQIAADIWSDVPGVWRVERVL